MDASSRWPTLSETFHNPGDPRLKTAGGQPCWRKCGRALGRVLVAVALAGLAACHGGGNVAQNISFESAAQPQGAGSGLVVVGLRVPQEPVAHGLLGDLPKNSIYQVMFREVGADNRFGRVYRGVQICDSVRALIGGFSSCRPDDLQFRVLSVPPGRYTLESIDYQLGNIRVVTYFNSLDQGAFSRRTVRDANQSFTVDAGSIVYIGDLNFTFDQSERHTIGAHVVLRRHDDLAAQALATYPNVHGPMIFRPATGRWSGTAAPIVVGTVPSVLDAN